MIFIAKDDSIRVGRSVVARDTGNAKTAPIKAFRLRVSASRFSDKKRFK